MKNRIKRSRVKENIKKQPELEYHVETKDITLTQLLDLILHNLKSLDLRVIDTERKQNAAVESLNKFETDVMEHLHELMGDGDEDDGPEGVYA